MHRLFKILASSLLALGCGKKSNEDKTVEVTLYESDLDNDQDMDRLTYVMGTLIETWDHRYTFEHDRKQPKLTFTVPNFTLTVVEDGDDMVALLFEEAGTKHRVLSTPQEAPEVVEALLFPDPQS